MSSLCDLNDALVGARLSDDVLVCLYVCEDQGGKEGENGQGQTLREAEQRQKYVKDRARD